MAKIFDKLDQWGCDTIGAMDRFLEDEELYVTCLETVITDEAFEKLGQALKEQKIQDAFEYAHTLKGVLANLGLTPMFVLAEEIVEPLRAGKGENLLPVYEKLLEANEYLKQILGK